MFEGVPPWELREQVEGLAQLFELTQRMVLNPKCKAALVLPALQTQLAAGVAAWGRR